MGYNSIAWLPLAAPADDDLKETEAILRKRGT